MSGSPFALVNDELGVHCRSESLREGAIVVIRELNQSAFPHIPGDYNVTFFPPLQNENNGLCTAGVEESMKRC